MRFMYGFVLNKIFYRTNSPHNNVSTMSHKKSSHSYSSMQDQRQKRVPRVRYNSDMYDLIAARTEPPVKPVSDSIIIERPRKSSEEYMSNSFGGKILSLIIDLISVTGGYDGIFNLYITPI